MADPYDDPYDQTTTANTAFAPFVPGDPQMLRQMLDQHQGRLAEREREAEGIQKKQELNVQQMQEVLDRAAKRIRTSRAGESNLSLMALGAGMVGTPGDFGTQLGAGLKAMVPQIQKNREAEAASEKDIADLQLQSAKLAGLPLEHRLAYIKAMQSGDMATIRAIEQQLAKSQTAQVTAQGKADKLALDTQKLHASVIQKASAEALNQIKELNKDNDYTQEEMQRLYTEMFRRQLGLQASGAGIQLKDEQIEKALGMPMPAVGSESNVFPKPETMQQEGEKLGLPEMPRTYSDMGAKDRAKQRVRESEAYAKDRVKWDEQASHDKTADDQLREAESIIRARPDLLGLIAGRGWNVSPEAVRLKTLLTQLEISNVPKGQGQITDFERQLFKEAGAQMTNNPQAALQTIQQMRNANNRGVEHREFMDKYYKTYRTLEGASTKWEEYVRSKAGSYVTEQDGKLVPNPNRMPSEVYFKHQRLGSPPLARGPDGKWYIMRDGKPEPL